MQASKKVLTFRFCTERTACCNRPRTQHLDIRRQSQLILPPSRGTALLWFGMSAPHASRVGGAGGHGSVIPEAFGVAIPSNPQDLLMLIQKQHKKNVHKINKHTDVISRAQKQEQQRESYENRLMEFEDFMFKPEGAERLNRQFEHIRM
jgi:hypothetical protein